MLTKVLNLATGKAYYYSLPPQEAVNTCYEQYENNKWNTWDYHKLPKRAKLTKSGLHYSRGDYSARA